ncbi:MAG: hypothetical protein M1814_004270 [Vezdaea aestivalis]|nr:MAG: hypothetical protein M1814_004270 [Vezdaea aestivalis]
MSSFLFVCLFLRLIIAQIPPPLDESKFKVFRSPVDGNVTITYKSLDNNTCTTTFPSQQQFTGYVTLPPMTLAPIQQNYSINTFFWFIEARQSPETAPLTIWLNGGPGSSSMIGMFQENGPCEVVETGRESLGTKAREWGWDRASNMLFIDQPNQVGFSYDQLAKGTYNLVTERLQSTVYQNDFPPWTQLQGQFSSDNPSYTTNTTEVSAFAIWHMLQGFFDAFPKYKSSVHLFAESYGGKYGPVFASIWAAQNERRRNGTIPADSSTDIILESLGIVNGCVDDLVQGIYYPRMASNNTYGIVGLSETAAREAEEDYFKSCEPAINACRRAANASDPTGEGDVPSVGRLCSSASSICNNILQVPWAETGRSYYDIAHMIPDPFPSSQYLSYLNTAAVQSSIGTPINFTSSSRAVNRVFNSLGDFERVDPIDDLAFLLNSGVRVALIYGDRDFICNWLGGEAVSTAVAALARSPYPSSFPAAGYSELMVNSSYVGGAIRQFGNLSFTRIYDAGHLVPSYQPEAAFTLFSRIVRGRNELATGKSADLGAFSSKGTAQALHRNSVPESPKPICYIRSLTDSCTTAQLRAISNGQGTVINGVWYQQESDWPGVDPAVTKAPTATRTGVYIATATVTRKAGASSVRMPATWELFGAVSMLLVGQLWLT